MANYGLLTVKELAQILKIPEQSIYAGVKKGTFPLRPIKVGKLLRFRTSDLEEHVLEGGTA